MAADDDGHIDRGRCPRVVAEDSCTVAVSVPPSTFVPVAKCWKSEADIVKVPVDWPAPIVTVCVRFDVARKFLVCVSATETERAAVVEPVRVTV